MPFKEGNCLLTGGFPWYSKFNKMTSEDEARKATKRPTTPPFKEEIYIA
jgi:hypothetical protein